MRTPIQELIDKLNNVKSDQFCSIETIKGWAEAMLEEEKGVIMDAYLAGQDNGYSSSHSMSDTKEISPSDYYNETFNTK